MLNISDRTKDIILVLLFCMVYISFTAYSDGVLILTGLIAGVLASKSRLARFTEVDFFSVGFAVILISFIGIPQETAIGLIGDYLTALLSGEIWSILGVLIAVGLAVSFIWGLSLSVYLPMRKIEPNDRQVAFMVGSALASLAIASFFLGIYELESIFDMAKVDPVARLQIIFPIWNIAYAFALLTLPKERGNLNLYWKTKYSFKDLGLAAFMLVVSLAVFHYILSFSWSGSFLATIALLTIRNSIYSPIRKI